MYYSAALPLAATLPPNVTSLTDTSGRVAMVTVVMETCRDAEMHVVVEAFRGQKDFCEQLCAIINYIYLLSYSNSECACKHRLHREPITVHVSDRQPVAK